MLWSDSNIIVQNIILLFEKCDTWKQEVLQLWDGIYKNDIGLSD